MLTPDKVVALTDEERMSLHMFSIAADVLEEMIDEMEADENMSDPAVAEEWCKLKRALIITKKEEANNV